jgi:hypothetical protein
VNDDGRAERSPIDDEARNTLRDASESSWAPLSTPRLAVAGLGAVWRVSLRGSVPGGRAAS